MKVLHIIDSGGLYGAEVMLLNLMAEQVAMGMTPVVASIGEKNIAEKPLETEAKKRGFRVKTFRMKPGPNVFGAYEILKYARKERFDILHSHGYKGNILFGLIPKQIRKIPMISTLHGYTSTSGVSKMKIYEWLDLFSHNFIDQVVLVNQGMLTHPKLKKQKIKYQIVNNGIPTTPTNSGDATYSRIEDFCKGRFTLGSIGRLSPEKGYKYLIKAFSLLVKKGVDACLVIIGEGEEAFMLAQMVEDMGISHSVFFAGYLNHAGNYIPNFDVYVIPSLTEGLPITLLEAMKAQIPVIASRVGGIPEVLDQGQCGILVQPGNAEDLFENVLRFYHHRNEFCQLSQRAYLKFAKNYTSNQMALAYARLYKRIVSTFQV